MCKGQNPFLSLVHHTTITQSMVPERFSQPVLVKKSDPNIPSKLCVVCVCVYHACVHICIYAHIYVCNGVYVLHALVCARV